MSLQEKETQFHQKHIKNTQMQKKDSQEKQQILKEENVQGATENY
jgi:hypothetical protein